MKADYWLERWRQSRIGFHRADANPRLVQHQRVFNDAVRVLVPLCGTASTVEHLRVELGMDGAADRLVLDLGQVGTFRPAVGQQVTVELGYTDGQDPQQVTVATVVDADRFSTTRSR